MTTWPNISTPESAIHEYEKLVRPARERFAWSPGIRRMINPETDAQTLAAFLLYFRALSIPITELVRFGLRESPRPSEPEARASGSLPSVRTAHVPETRS
jgi:hypothetical protein